MDRYVAEALNDIFRITFRVLWFFFQIGARLFGFLFRYGTDTMRAKRAHDRLQAQDKALRQVGRPGSVMQGTGVPTGDLACPSCSAVNPPGSERCYECFAKLQPASVKPQKQTKAVESVGVQTESYISSAGLLICPSCGTENSLSKERCYDCDTPLIKQGVAGGKVYPSQASTYSEPVATTSANSAASSMNAGCLVAILGVVGWVIAAMLGEPYDSGTQSLLMCWGWIAIPLGTFLFFYLTRRSLER